MVRTPGICCQTIRSLENINFQFHDEIHLSKCITNSTHKIKPKFRLNNQLEFYVPNYLIFVIALLKKIFSIDAYLLHGQTRISKKWYIIASILYATLKMYDVRVGSSIEVKVLGVVVLCSLGKS